LFVFKSVATEIIYKLLIINAWCAMFMKCVTEIMLSIPCISTEHDIVMSAKYSPVDLLTAVVIYRESLEKLLAKCESGLW
jgi:hypothetical protein